MCKFKNLHLERDKIDDNIGQFSKDNALEVRAINSNSTGKVKRATIGAVGINDGFIDLYLNSNGTTTINWKIGKNQILGEKLAIYLLNTLDPEQFSSVNFSLKGISSDDIDPIIDEIESSTENGNKEFDIETKENSDVKKLIYVHSREHDDTLTITHFKTTKRLLIQGKTLFTYRRIIYLLSELLDLNGLQKVLSYTDEDTVSIVRDEIAKDYLKEKLDQSFEHLPQFIQKLLISGCCVKLASPSLPEYSMLLFPDLRALEGVLRTILGEYDMFVEDEKYGFGCFFNVQQDCAILRDEFKDNITSPELMTGMENAYSFFRKHRHTLFHMRDFAEASRKIDTLDKALALSNETYLLINKIYEAKI